MGWQAEKLPHSRVNLLRAATPHHLFNLSSGGPVNHLAAMVALAGNEKSNEQSLTGWFELSQICGKFEPSLHP